MSVVSKSIWGRFEKPATGDPHLALSVPLHIGSDLVIDRAHPCGFHHVQGVMFPSCQLDPEPAQGRLIIAV